MMTGSPAGSANLGNPPETAYLAGAGISIPPPPALPGATAFIEALVGEITGDPEQRRAILDHTLDGGSNTRFRGDFLRFEAVVSCIKFAVDPDMELLRIYSGCGAPNHYHHHLAQQLGRGAVVLTTNFDNLIEIACRTVGVDYSLVVTENELAAFCEDPAQFKNPLIKLHGGHDLTYAEGRQSPGAINVRATLEQVGSIYLGRGANHLADAISSVTGDRHLVVMGYSGCDDFDVMPCIMAADLPRGLTWIDHDDQHPETVKDAPPDRSNLPPYQLLLAHRRKRRDVSVVRGTTSAALDIDTDTDIGGESFDWTKVFAEWSQRHLRSAAHRKLLLGQILSLVECFDESIAILESIPPSELSEEQQDVLNVALCSLYGHLSDSSRAIRSLSVLAGNDREVDGVSLKGLAYYNLARVNTNLDQFNEASAYLGAALKIFKRAGDAGRISDCLHEHGRILTGAGQGERAARSIEESIRLCEKLGDLHGAGVGYGEMARALAAEGRLDEAETYADKAINLFALEGSGEGLGIAHHTRGYILAQRCDWAGAAAEFTTAIAYERSAQAMLDLAHSLHSLGDMCIGLKEFDRAERSLEEAIEIKHGLGDKDGVARSELLLRMLKQLQALGTE